MKELRMILLAVLLPLVSGQLTGTWTGSMGEKRDDGSYVQQETAYLQLQQQDNQITGSVGPSSSETHAIDNASFSEDELKFSMHYLDPNSETVTWAFDLQVHGDSMEGTGTGKRGANSWTVAMRLSRH
jgi:hypothetical protein